MSNFTHHQDYISDFAYNKERNSVVVSSADGSLSMICLKKRDLLYQTSTCMDELLSCCVIKNGNCVCAGTQEGNVNVYKWDEEDDLMDRITGHPESIDGMLKVDEDTICTGSEDGILRIVQVMPNRFLGVAGMFEEFPVERMEWSFDRAFIGASSHDSVLRLFDMSILNDDDDDDDDEDDKENDKENDKEDQKENQKGGKDSDDSDESDESDESDDSDAKPSKKRGKRSKPTSAKNLKRQKVVKKDANEGFYDDL